MGLDLAGVDLSDVYLVDANMTNADLSGADLTGATLIDVIWGNTTCPDGTNSNTDGDTCVNDLG